MVKSRPVGTKKPVLMAGFDDDLLTKQDPDDAALAQNRAEWGEVVAEDPLEILEDPTVALELSEDPVRLYLKEIGQIHLLDADSEFRLAARIEAKVRVDTLVNHAVPVRTIRWSFPFDLWQHCQRHAHFLGETAGGCAAHWQDRMPRPGINPGRSTIIAPELAGRCSLLFTHLPG